jgi:hypothetical protein
VKPNFKRQAYQADAVHAVVDCFQDQADGAGEVSSSLKHANGGHPHEKNELLVSE